MVLSFKSVLIFAVGVECGENRGRTGGAQKNRGRTGGIWEENRGRTGGFWYSFTKSTGGEAGALGQEPGGEPGGGNFLRNKRPNSGPENQRTGPPVKISTKAPVRVSCKSKVVQI